MAAGVAHRGTGWRSLGLFWGCIVAVAAIGCGTLQFLGPPAPPPAPIDVGRPASPPSPPPSDVTTPQAGLLEPSKQFAPALLPRVAADGKVARVVYARGVDPADKRPRVALVVTGLGMSEADTRAAIQTLPPPVTLAFSPYAANPDPLVQLCRAAGHEMLISIPLEPQGFPLNDAGSRSLLTGALAQQNATNLEWSLGRTQGYVGATGALDGMRGERFAELESSWKTMLRELGRRGLLYVDPRPGRTNDALADVPGRAVDLVVDDPPARAEIEGKLAALERMAKEKGEAIGLAGPLRPVTIERIAAWAKGLDDRGIVLAPVSALINARTK